MVARRFSWFVTGQWERFVRWSGGRVEWRSFPFNGGGRLGGYVVDPPVHLAHFIDNAAGHAGQDLMGYLRPVGGHAVDGGNRSYRYDVGVGAEVAHHAPAVGGEEDSEGLPYLPVEACGA